MRNRSIEERKERARHKFLKNRKGNLKKQQNPYGDTESKPRQDAGEDEEYYGEIDPNEQTSLFDKGNDVGDWARGLSEGAFLAPTAALDFGVDVVNLIPGVNFKKINKFKDQNLQALRDLASVALPTIGLTGLTGAGGTAFATNVAKLEKLTCLGKILNSPLTRWAGGVSAGAGSGVLVRLHIFKIKRTQRSRYT